MAAGAAPSLAQSTRYKQTNLVSDGTIPAAHVDTHLVNAWGIVFNPTGFVSVNAADGGVAVLYDGAGNPAPVRTPWWLSPSANSVYDPLGNPTGIVFSGSTSNSWSLPARPRGSVFATEQGIIAAWAPTVDATHAIFMRQTPGAVYKGLALAGNGNGNFLYAADFLGGKIDMFDNAFNPVDATGRFVDPHLPRNFSPFNIQAIQGDLYVTYAFHEPGDDEETPGPGLGFVNVFDANGQLIRRVATRGANSTRRGASALAPAVVRPLRQPPARRQFRRRRGSTPTTRITERSRASSATRPASRSRSTGSGALRLATASRGSFASTLSTSRPDPTRSHTGLYGSITAVAGSKDDEDDDD